MRESKDLTRSQLVGMVCSLKGEIWGLLHTLKLIKNRYKINKSVSNEIEDIMVNTEILLNFTAFAPSKEDMLLSPDSLPDGTFDDSWMD